jgi:diacylglycerol kinase family enzyme
VPIQLDGEAAGHTPAVIQLLDHPLQFIVAP